MTKNQYLDLVVSQYGGTRVDYENFLELTLIALAEYNITRKIIRDKIPSDNKYILPNDFYKVIVLRTRTNNEIEYTVTKEAGKNVLIFENIKIFSKYFVFAYVNNVIDVGVDTQNFVLEYSYLVEDVPNNLLIPVNLYMKYLIYTHKSNQVMNDQNIRENIVSIQESDGQISQNINFGNKEATFKSLSDKASMAFQEFQNYCAIPYFSRG